MKTMRIGKLTRTTLRDLEDLDYEPDRPPELSVTLRGLRDIKP